MSTSDFFLKVQLRHRLGWAYVATLLAGGITALTLMIIQPAISLVCTSLVSDACTGDWSLIATIVVFVGFLAATSIWCGLGPWFWMVFCTLTVLMAPFLMDESQTWPVFTILVLAPLLSVLASLPKPDGTRSRWHLVALVLALVLACIGVTAWLVFLA